VSLLIVLLEVTPGKLIMQYSGGSLDFNLRGHRLSAKCAKIEAPRGGVR